MTPKASRVLVMTLIRRRQDKQAARALGMTVVAVKCCRWRARKKFSGLRAAFPPWPRRRSKVDDNGDEPENGRPEHPGKGAVEG
ncbi:MAG: hypothetical protein ABSH08_13940 [Tepidisphaeraceae bacterium]